MSRVGKKPIPIPEKVTVTVADGKVTVKGPGGTLVRAVPPEVGITVAAQQAVVTRKNDTPKAKGVHGLYRALLANMVHGVVQGFQKNLDLVGVGYRAELKGKDLRIALGFSNPVDFPIPEGIKVQVDKQTRIVVSGANNELVGEVSAQLRKLRPPEPYKGKGVRYADEHIRKKAGKAAAGSSVGAGK